MGFAGKPPPRYVPTLTEVVNEPEALAIGAEAAVHRADPLPEPVPEWESPPVPEHEPWSAPQPEVGPEPDPEPEPEPERAPPESAAPLRAAAPVLRPEAETWLHAEELLVQRLLERVDQVLDERLRETIAQVVQAQTRSLTLRLQEELEAVGRQTVQEAVAHERLEQGARARG